ncbi:D-alanine--D-alanine ligase [Streptomyces sp. NBC_00687]|uniref:D-alanine--D-alanine ligase family protein n=1 Tax=Streptomyces sp. NBC_00687 TaxID=2975807 RepID=UPI00225858B9|nr:D-alanine--D-alanine ligase [Streptomyces sp. NBC_00687]MCX4918996.1 D-alanine--D-alanine ligase [Streptomyces sp. NBC_00687]
MARQNTKGDLVRRPYGSDSTGRHDIRGLIIGVITGGVSQERDRSLLSGRTVHESLSSRGYRTKLIDSAEPNFLDQLREIDVAFLAIAGQYAEDGKLQGLLEMLRIPYTGSGVLASALGMQKAASKKFVAALGIPVLGHAELDLSGDVDILAKGVAEAVGFPVMLKPLSEGGSVGMSIASNPAEFRELIQSLDASTPQEMFAERYCAGRSVTVGVIDGPAGPQALPALEAISVTKFYDYDSKRNPAMHSYQCPALLESALRDQISENAVTVHKELGCIGYSRSDFIVDETGKGYFLEINTLPGLSRTGNLATMAQAQGIEYDNLVEFILESALERDEYVA